MILSLMGLPGKLKTLLDRLTSTRAAKLDNLDTQISTRAAAATALSNATWTDGLAAVLAGALALDRAEMVGVSGSTGTSGGLKTLDTTIPAVTIGKAIALPAGGFYNNTTGVGFQPYFLNPTTLRVVYYYPGGSNVSVSFVVALVAFQ